MAAPTVNSGATTASETSNASNHTINTPTHSEGDVIYIYAFSSNGGANMTKPSGFSDVFSEVAIYGTVGLHALWRKEAGASEPSTYTYTTSMSIESCTIAFSVSDDGGVDVVSANNTGNTSPASCATATSTVDDTLVLRCVATEGNTLPHGTVTDHTLIEDIGHTNGSVSVQYEIQATAGAVGQVQPSLASANKWAGRTVIIKPSGGGGGGPAEVEYVRTAGANGVNFTMDIGTAGTDRLVTVHIGDEKAALNAITGVTVDGKACTLLHNIVNTIGAGNAQQFWYITESTLGASNGVVTIAFTGTWDTGHRADAMLHTGVQDGAPYDSGYDNTSGPVGKVTVTGIDCPTNGLVVGTWMQGADAGGAVTSITSPHTQRFLTVPSSATLVGSSGVETSGATNKTYVLDWVNTNGFRQTGIIATWPAAATTVVKQTHQMMI